jgi:biopolymer transport protein ExbB/TolQ
MSILSEVLNWISNSFLLPVIVLLLAGMLMALVELGSFCSSYLLLLKQRRQRDEIMASLRAGAPIDPDTLGHGVFARHLKELIDLGWNTTHCEKAIFDISQTYECELERAKYLMKVAPMVGLMGTLIPMGPALGGLASGDIAAMAYNMQIAFATTVLGIVVSGVEMLVYTVKRQWYKDEIAGLRYALDLNGAG